jgi:NTE family protein
MPRTLDITTFTQHEKVTECLKRLKNRFGEHGEKMIVSDVIDDKGHQFVNLVQKGGGVLGVALVGYTYILECMNIRFLKLAGTSAGAINTALMTVIGEKTDMKSDKILDAICKLEFFSFVDGHPTAKWAIKNFIQSDNFKNRLKIWAIVLSGFLALLIGADIFLTMFQHKDMRLVHWTLALYILTGFMLLLLLLLVFYCVRLVRRLKNAGFGINPGNAFYDWIKGHMLNNNVKTVTDLRNKAARKVDGMKLRYPDHPNKMEGLTGDVTFIASELVTESKIQFPGMCDLFRLSNDIDDLQPAGFVRASMSIPIFFESYVIKDIPCTHDDIKTAWQKLNVDEPPSVTRFVDGGILSNFPVSVFYNPNVEVPRLPVFGIDLDDTEEKTEELNPGNWSLGQYLGNLFNTVRNYYDRDFLIKNTIYEQGIGRVKVKGFNWLDFFLSDEKKIQLFVIGACAATDFLLQFEWESYKGARVEAKKNKLL